MYQRAKELIVKLNDVLSKINATLNQMLDADPYSGPAVREFGSWVSAFISDILKADGEASVTATIRRFKEGKDDLVTGLASRDERFFNMAKTLIEEAARDWQYTLNNDVYLLLDKMKEAYTTL